MLGYPRPDDSGILRMALLVLRREFLERFLDHFLVFAFRDLQVGQPARSAPAIPMIEGYVALAAVMACAALLCPIARMIFEKPRCVRFA